MNLSVKSIIISMFCSLSLVAMDGDRKREAAESRPTKEKIAQAIVQANVLPNVLAPVIAGYAENPGKGYMFCVPNKAGKMSEFLEGTLEQYQEKWPEIMTGISQDSVMVEIWVSSKVSIAHREEEPHPWNIYLCPHLPIEWIEEESIPKNNFPSYLPATLIKNLKEGDSLFITLKEIPLELVCSQLTHRYKYCYGVLCPFEKAFSQVTEGLLEENPKEQAEAHSAQENLEKEIED